MSTLASNERNAFLELQHIELELKNKRKQHLRHFVDQYYCYKNNHVNRNGRAKWEDIVFKGVVSVEARQLNRKEVVKEHVVPLLVITQRLVELAKSGEMSCQSIAELLDRYVHFATISKREDALLRDKKLTSKMPDGFYEEGHTLYNDPYSRYKIAEIELENCQLIEQAEEKN